jgi:hypothetical protein
VFSRSGCFQINDVQIEFQECSHNKSMKVYETIQEMQEGRYSRETNDLAEEIQREDRREATLDPIKDIKPLLCNALKVIGKECIQSFNRCFSKDDADQMKRQHIEQMQKYYSTVYDGVDLKDCPGLAFMKEDYSEDDDYTDPAENEVQDDYDYTYNDDEYDDDDDYNEMEVGEHQGTDGHIIPSKSKALTDEATPFPDPEGNAVIAEPPSNVKDASKASSSYAKLTLFVLIGVSLVTLKCFT